ncbi:MAG: type VII secretion protein EssC [Bacillota bacterium]
METSGPPVFYRSPRLHPELPQGEVEIPGPPSRPPAFHLSLASILLYLLPGLLGTLLVSALIRRHTGQSAPYALYSLPMMAIAALVQVGTYFYQKHRHQQALIAREQRYLALLQECRQELERQRVQQQHALREMNPTPGECLARAERRDPRLWERSSQDADCLSLRLGVGEVPFAVTVKPPRSDPTADPDPLLRQAQELAAEFARVTGAPICLPLRELGVAGIVGPRPEVVKAARALTMQIATHHGPDEVQLVVLFPAAEAEEWLWLRWLPHVWSPDRRQRYLAMDPDGAEPILSGLYDLLARRRLEAVGQPGSSPRDTPLPLFVFLLADPRLAEGDPILPLLLREGPALGAHTIFLAERRELLPKECRGIAEVGPGAGNLILTAPSPGQIPFAPDEASREAAERLARALAPLRPHRMAAAAEIPDRVTLLDVLDLRRVEELDVLARWRSATPHRSLAVPIGRRAGGELLVLDLHERGYGPHGLVAGATGSGKSELLQTLVASLAVHFHPHDLAFVMVDYKGGGMAGAFRDLPHVVGTLTNLDGGLARRALAALKAELRRRQRLLAEAGVDHIDKYIRARREGRPLPPLPHLVILVDEFAELKAEQPEFMRELVSAVRVGRSLGVHLILATQKPAGVVDEQIWSNTRFRICLRVERPQDSQEVLKSPLAATITGSGRAYFQVGNNERFELFQSGWAGAPYRPEAGDGEPEAALTIAEVALDGTRVPLWPAAREAPAPESGETQLQALVAHLAAAARAAGIAPLPGPWLPPLPEAVPLDRLGPREGGWDGQGWTPAGRWLEPVVGLMDWPEEQRQGPLRIPLGREGHLAVFGAPGMGKTTFLQTLVTSLALDHSPGELQVYLLDASGRGLSLLRGLPHVGAVVRGDETERLERLFRLLLGEMEARKARLAEAGAGTLAAYRQAGGELPAILLVVDDLPALASNYPEGEERLAVIAREGASLGLHLVVTAHTPSVLRSRIGNNITQAVTLRLADRMEYAGAVGRTDGLEPAPVPGRGLVKGKPPLEFQTALPVEGSTDWERAERMKALFQTLDRAWQGPRPRPVRTLPEVIPLSEVLPLEPEWSGEPELETAVPLGLEVDSLEPFRVDLREGPHFCISGPPESGKTSLLQAWVVALAHRLPPDWLHLWLVDLGEGSLEALQALPHVREAVATAEELDAALQTLADLVQERRRGGVPPASPAALGPGAVQPAVQPLVVVAVDDFQVCRDAISPATRDRWEQLLRRERGAGLHFLLAGSSTAFQQGYDGLGKAVRELQTGFALGSTEHSDLAPFNLRLPPAEAGRLLPPGLGYYVRRSRFRKVKVATAQVGDPPLGGWVEALVRRWESGCCPGPEPQQAAR